MTEKQSEDAGAKDMFAQWTQSMNDMWGGILRLWTPTAPFSPDTEPAEKSDTDQARADRIRASVEAALSNWQTAITCCPVDRRIGESTRLLPRYRLR